MRDTELWTEETGAAVRRIRRNMRRTAWQSLKHNLGVVVNSLRKLTIGCLAPLVGATACTALFCWVIVRVWTFVWNLLP